jgi:succinoglycan biosynthesis protein ExoM
MTTPLTDVRPSDIVIGIPTFRRPELLAALLESLLPELEARPAQVIIADNDCGVDAPAVVEAFKEKWPHIVCIPVSARGVAQVRNALVSAAAQLMPGWEWLLMLDDDGVVTQGWMSRLLATGTEFDVHLVGGPVEGVLPNGANMLARNSIFASRRRWRTGLVPTLNTTQNLAISRRTLQLIQEPLFRNEYGASGGEDYDLFRRVAHSKGRIAWCDEAVVIEPAQADRLTVRSLLQRYATTGAYMVAIDRSYDGSLSVWIQALKGMITSCVRALLAALTLKSNRFAQSVLAVSHYSGRMAGLLGVKTSRYVEPAKRIG